MSAPTKISFARRPSMVPAYARVLLGKKPYSAPEGTKIEPVELEARKVVLSAAHLQSLSRSVRCARVGHGLAAGLSARARDAVAHAAVRGKELSGEGAGLDPFAKHDSCARAGG
jgi:hypothetical protein